MKNIFKFLVLTVSLSVAVCITDYCEMEERLCGKEKHVGCNKHEFPKWIDRLTLGKTTAEFKELILDKVNSFRSLIATGQRKPLFESAPNMRLVTWNNEMEYLASRLITVAEGACCKTDEHPNSSSMWKFIEKNVAPIDFLTSTFDEIFKKSTEERFYSVNLTSIGCAFGFYNNKRERMDLECVLNEPKASSLPNTYLQGEPCSKCSPNNQICSERYPGLCEDVKVLPVEPKGEPGGVNVEKGDQGPVRTAGRVGPSRPPSPVGPAGMQWLQGIFENVNQGLKGETGLPEEAEKPAVFGVAVVVFGPFNSMKSGGLFPWHSS